MVKLRTFDNAQLLIEHSEKPHYKDDVVCFKSEYKDKIHLENEQYFNKELYMILVLEGYSKIRLNGELITIGANTLLIHENKRASDTYIQSR